MIHTDPTLSRLLHALGSNPGRLKPLLIVGRPGIGKKFHARQLVRQLACAQGYRPFRDSRQSCDCAPCRRIEAGQASDFSQLYGTEPIAVTRDAMAAAVGRLPALLPQRYVLLANLHLHSPDALGTLLKPVEECPPHVRILATARSAEAIPASLLSRFVVLRHSGLSPEHVATLAGSGGVPGLMQAGTYAVPFGSASAFRSYVSLDFEARFQELFADAEAAKVELFARSLVKHMRAVPGDFGATLGQFVEWLVRRIRSHAMQHDGLSAFAQLLSSLVLKSQITFRPEARHPLVNLESQFVSLVLSLHLLRRSTSV